MAAPEYILPELVPYYMHLKSGNRAEPDFLKQKYFDMRRFQYKYNDLFYHHNLILKALRDKAKDYAIQNPIHLSEIDEIIAQPEMSLYMIIDMIERYYPIIDNNSTRSLLIQSNPNNTRFSTTLDDEINNQIRSSLIWTIGYCYITNEGIMAIREYIFQHLLGPVSCISVASGLGFIEYCLENYGPNLIVDCYDMLIGFNDINGVQENGWKFPILEDIASADRNDPIDYDVLLLSWPPEKKDVAYHCIRRFTGNYVIYIGEYSMENSCTANNTFHQYLYEHFNLDHTYSTITHIHNMQVKNYETYASINLLSRK